MAYTLNWTDEDLKDPITIEADTTDTDSTPLTLIGKGTRNWGEPMQENLLHLLEHFASNGFTPNEPTVGMLWYDADSNTLFLRTVDETWAQVYPHPDT